MSRICICCVPYSARTDRSKGRVLSHAHFVCGYSQRELIFKTFQKKKFLKINVEDLKVLTIFIVVFA